MSSAFFGALSIIQIKRIRTSDDSGTTVLCALACRTFPHCFAVPNIVGKKCALKLAFSANRACTIGRFDA
jgi:hypothetical protein